MEIGFVTLFPTMVLDALDHSMMSRARSAGLVSFSATNPRDFAYDRHRKVDDRPFGGEPGMLIRPEPVERALRALKLEKAFVVLTSPTGRRFEQKDAAELGSRSQIVFLCGHYEGFDHRVEMALVHRSYSIGDFVITNGELAALTMVDSIVRLIPGVLGDPGSLTADAHSDGLLSAPNYTLPPEWKGLTVPDVLRSGNHRAIAEWRRSYSLKSTAELRPDLLSRAPLTPTDLKLLSQSSQKMD